MTSSSSPPISPSGYGALGIDHGRDRDGDSANTLPTRVEAGLEKEPESKEEQVIQIFKEIGRHHRQSDQ